MSSLSETITTSTRALISRQNPTYWAAGAVLGLSITRWVVQDYQEYLSLGRGGPPYNFFGWTIVTVLLRPLSLSKQQALSTAGYPDHGSHEAIRALTERSGSRPVVKGIAPHRQMSQNAPENMREQVNELFQEALRRNPDLLEWKLSLYEVHGPALYVKDSVSDISETAALSRREIGHPHQDLSIHLYLSPADAKVAMEKGWGERHRMTTSSMRWMHIGSTYLMFYGPRNEEELAALRVFLKHSIMYMTNRDKIDL